MAEPTLSELLNAANWEYYQSLNQPPSDLLPLFNSNSDNTSLSWQSDGMNAEVFKTSAGALIVAFEGTNVNPASPAYTPEFASGSIAADESIFEGTDPTDIAAMTDAAAFMTDVATYAATNHIASSDIYVTGHSLGAALASWVSFADGYTGTGFATPGLSFGSTTLAGAGTMTNYVDYGDGIGNFANNPPDPEGDLPGAFGGDPTHYDTTTYIGMPSQRSVVEAVGTLFDSSEATGSNDTLAEDAKLLLGSADLYHPIENYAAQLGLALTNTTPGSAGTGAFGGLSALAIISSTAVAPYSAADVASVSFLVDLLQGASTIPSVTMSIYDATNLANTNMGFVPAVAGMSNIAVLDPDLTVTTNGTTMSLDPSGTYAAPAGYAAMIATGNFAYTMTHDSGAAMRLIANAGLDTIVSAVSGDTVQAGTGYLFDIQKAGNFTFVGGSNASTVFGGPGSTTYYGAGGNDLVVGGSGSGDLLIAGSGSTTLAGGGASTLFGGSGADVLLAGPQSVVVAGTSSATLVGSSSDAIFLSGGNSSVFGAANDTIVGGGSKALAVLGGGAETFWGGEGAATVFGGTGALNLVLGSGGDVVVGGSGTATFNAIFGTTAGNTTIFDFSAANDRLAFSGYSGGMVTQSIVNGSLVVEASGATITLVDVTSPLPLV